MKNFRKNKTLLMKRPTKLIKVYSRQLSISPNKTHYSQKILQFKYDIRKRWTIMKEIIGKAKQLKIKLSPET